MLWIGLAESSFSNMEWIDGSDADRWLFNSFLDCKHILWRGQMRLMIALLFLVFLTVPVNGECQDDTITWYQAEFQPGTILEGPLKGQGYHDAVQSHLIESLPQYKHVVKTAHFGRIIEQLKMGNACSVALIRTSEREKFLYYSAPNVVGLMNGVHVLRSRINDFKPFVDQKGYISLQNLYSSTQFRMGVSKGRRYGKVIDSLVAGAGQSKKVYMDHRGTVFSSLAKLLQAGRIDYVIGYPQEIQWLVKTHAVDDVFAFFPIQEGPHYMTACVACTKNEWGKRVISQVEEILGGRPYAQATEQMKLFLPPEAVPIYEKILREEFPDK